MSAFVLVTGVVYYVILAFLAGLDQTVLSLCVTLAANLAPRHVQCLALVNAMLGGVMPTVLPLFAPEAAPLATVRGPIHAHAIVDGRVHCVIWPFALLVACTEIARMPRDNALALLVGLGHCVIGPHAILLVSMDHVLKVNLSTCRLWSFYTHAHAIKDGLEKTVLRPFVLPIVLPTVLGAMYLVDVSVMFNGMAPCVMSVALDSLVLSV
jgi:hypothetical protein